jgi:hypothetical protein
MRFFVSYLASFRELLSFFHWLCVFVCLDEFMCVLKYLIGHLKEPTVLRAILAKLKSGEEGSYPHLAAHTEERLLSLLPAKERSKVSAFDGI